MITPLRCPTDGRQKGRSENRPRYRLELVALPHVDQPAYALRQLLRRALRTHGFRCTSVEEIPPEKSR
jgi:hypothetical protein